MDSLSVDVRVWQRNLWKLQVSPDLISPFISFYESVCDVGVCTLSTFLPSQRDDCLAYYYRREVKGMDFICENGRSNIVLWHCQQTSIASSIAVYIWAKVKKIQTFHIQRRWSRAKLHEQLIPITECHCWTNYNGNWMTSFSVLVSFYGSSLSFKFHPIVTQTERFLGSYWWFPVHFSQPSVKPQPLSPSSSSVCVISMRAWKSFRSGLVALLVWNSHCFLCSQSPSSALLLLATAKVDKMF